MNTSLFVSLVPYIIPLALPFLIALAASLYMGLVQHLPMQQRLIVSSMAHTVVRAVEQMTQADAPGAQKKDMALHALVSILGGIGIRVPAPMLEMAIEAAVFELHTMYPHSEEADPDIAGPFAYKPTLRSLPTVQIGTTSTAPTEPIPINKERQP